jgi:hypothetical protein
MVAIGGVGHRVGAGLAAFGSGGGQEEQGGVGELSPDLAAISPKFRNYLLVEIVSIAHNYVSFLLELLVT